jgi:hypothetical protein
MPEPKHFLIAPNCEHSLATGIFVAVPAISAWMSAHLNNSPLPKFDWTINKETGEIVATVHEGKVHSVQAWWANSCGANEFDGGKLRRDYRIAHLGAILTLILSCFTSLFPRYLLDNPCGCGVYADGYCANLKAAWDKKTLEGATEKGKRTYRVKFDAPEDGRWVAFLMDFKFVNPNVVAGLDPTSLNAEWKAHPETPAGKIAYQFSRYFENFGGFPHDFAHFFEFTTGSYFFLLFIVFY